MQEYTPNTDQLRNKHNNPNNEQKEIASMEQ